VNPNHPHYLRGILFALVTATLWGLLPIFLKVALTGFSAPTIAWFRFAFAFIVLLGILSFTRKTPTAILRRPPLLGILGGCALAVNYLTVTMAVHLSGPSYLAILIQTAPVALVLVGLIFFHEKMTRRQLFGLAVAVAGFVLFYIHQQESAGEQAPYPTRATVYVMAASAAWVLYMVCQKILSRDYRAQSLNLLVYGTAALVLAFKVPWAEFVGVDAASWLFLIFLGVNTLLAYGALAEAINLIPISVISILISLNPLITLGAMLVLPEISDGRLPPDPTGTLGYIGAMIAVAGVVLVVAQRSQEE
jgi:drug/metabolite transporter (DMT)-like permease